MKKIITAVIVSAMVMSFAACGNKAPEGQVADLFSAGYEVYMSSGSEGDLNVMLKNDENSYITITVPAKQSEVDEYFALDCTAEDYNDTVCEFLSEQKSVTIEDISDAVPDQETLDAYVGMTIGELMEQGFEEWGSSWVEGGTWSLIFDDGTINITCMFDEPSDKGPDEMSQEEKDVFVVSEVEFNGISSNYFH